MNTMMLPSMQTDKTLSIEGVAADAKAVGDVLATIPEFEYGVYIHPDYINATHSYVFNIKLNKPHSTAPKTILISYRTYNYFYGSIHVDVSKEITKDGFDVVYIPKEIGNGKGLLLVDWVAIW